MLKGVKLSTPGDRWRILDQQEGLMVKVGGPKKFEIYWLFLFFHGLTIAYWMDKCGSTPGQLHLY